LSGYGPAIFGLVNFFILTFVLFRFFGKVTNQFLYARRMKAHREMLESVVALKRARGRSAHSHEVYESLPKDITSRREAISKRCRKECDIVRADARFKAEHMIEGARRLAEEESARAERLVRAKLLSSAFALAGEDLQEMAKRDGGAEFADRGLRALSGVCSDDSN